MPLDLWTLSLPSTPHHTDVDSRQYFQACMLCIWRARALRHFLLSPFKMVQSLLCLSGCPPCQYYTISKPKYKSLHLYSVYLISNASDSLRLPLTALYPTADICRLHLKTVFLDCPHSWWFMVNPWNILILTTYWLAWRLITGNQPRIHPWL